MHFKQLYFSMFNILHLIRYLYKCILQRFCNRVYIQVSMYIHLFQISLSGPKATDKKLTTAKDFGNLLIN